MLEQLDARAADDVLEIGAGTGYNAALLAELVASGSVTTVDIDPDVALHARTRSRSMRSSAENSCGAWGSFFAQGVEGEGVGRWPAGRWSRPARYGAVRTAAGVYSGPVGSVRGRVRPEGRASLVLRARAADDGRTRAVGVGEVQLLTQGAVGCRDPEGHAITSLPNVLPACQVD
ncbi:methyltransferase domain-containing protein [Streptomyces albogriseolus]|uniref:methyltransferase domain-containing protein n=1 Tax=Streptomyces albogriseolus TaxID=1887 RepID=UPI0036F0E8D4